MLRSVHSRPHCGRRIGVISAITRQIGRMRPTLRPTRGRLIAADYERHNAFLVFITNAADARPTHYAVHSRPQCVDGASAACGRFGEWSQRSLRCVDACVTVSKHWKSWKSHYNMTLVTSFDAFDARGRRIVVHSWSGKLRPHCGRNASAAVRQTRVGRNAADYVPTLTRKWGFAQLGFEQLLILLIYWHI